jgi:Zn-dependent protease with chaperone function
MATTGTERRTFYEMQRRHRRSGWRFTALSALAVLVLGLPLSVVISPFLLATGLVVNDVADLVTPTPDLVGEIRDRLESASGDGADPAAGDGTLAPETMAWIGLALVVPGMLAMLALWLAVRRLFLRAGAGAFVVAAGARPPRPGDVEERQLVNLVEEMALAAGVPPPRVLLVDADDANAAVVGRSVDDATLVVPRGLLTELGRDATGAVVADMLAVVVNGDLRAAMVIASLYQALDVVGALLAAPLDRRTRRALWRALRLSLGRASRHDGAEMQAVAEELAYVAQLGGLDGTEDTNAALLLLTFPFMVANIAFTMVRFIVGGFIVSPVLAALWRRRRLLADATAVELTRNPDALARALDHLRRHGAVTPPGPWTHLGAVGPEVARERAMARMERRREEIWGSERRPDESRGRSLARRLREAQAAGNELQRDLQAVDATSVATDHDARSAGQELASFLPPLGKRLARLDEMGAHLPDDPAEAWSPAPRRWWHHVLGWALGIPLLAVFAVLMLALLGCLAAFVYLALLFEAALLAPVVLVVNALVR